MLTVIFGENRVAAEREVKRRLGVDYEVFDGEKLTTEDLANVFWGTSLFETKKRRILLKNVTENAEVWAKLADYRETSHDVVIWEGKVDKRSAGYKALKEAGVELQEFAALAMPETKAVFGILDLAFTDGRRAVQEVEKIEMTQDPFMFFGLLVTQILKRYEATRAGARERRILKEMAKVDLLMKTSGLEPWTLVKGFLRRIKSFS